MVRYVCTVVWHILWQVMVRCVAHTVAGNGVMFVLLCGTYCDMQ